MFKLIRRNLLRNKRRTILTVLSIAIALILLAFLNLLLAAMSGVNSASANRLVVRNAISLTFSLPAAYQQRLAALEHVEGITIMNWFQGRYIDDRPENFFPRFGTDPETFLNVFPELELSPDEADAWLAERTAFIAGRALAEEQGWELGDVIAIEGNIYPVDIELTLRGIFTHPTNDAQERQIYFNWQYVEEALNNPGEMNTFYLLLDSPDNMNDTIVQAEAMFENSPGPGARGNRGRLFPVLSRDDRECSVPVFRDRPCRDRLHLPYHGQHHGHGCQGANDRGRRTPNPGLHPLKGYSPLCCSSP